MREPRSITDFHMLVVFVALTVMFVGILVAISRLQSDVRELQKHQRVTTTTVATP